MSEIDKVLSALDRIDWSSMTHCRGPAGDLPALIRTALGAPRASERRDARTALWERIQYQGSIVEPTAHVVPVLARALVAGRPDDRAPIASMIGQLAYATTMTEGQGVLRYLPLDDPRRAAVEQQLARETVWAAAVRRACWVALAPLLSLLDEDDEDLLVQVPFALVALIEGARDGAPHGVDPAATARTIADAIGARASRPATPKALIGFAFALGVLSHQVPEWAERLTASLPRAPLPVRTALALELADLAMSDAIADTLIEALAARAEHESWVPYPFPWRSGHLRFRILRALAEHAEDEAFDRALPLVSEVLRTETSQATFPREGLPVLVRALAGARIGPTTTRSELPRAALVVLDALHENPAMWAEPNQAVAVVLSPLGLENDRAAWTRLLRRD